MADISVLNLSHDEDRQELQKLNTGLEVYIERVRRLESQVHTLNAELETTQSIKFSSYDDGTLRQLQAELEETRRRLNAAVEKQSELKLKLDDAESDNRSLRSDVNQLRAEVDKLKSRIQVLLEELSQLRAAKGASSEAIGLEQESLKAERNRVFLLQAELDKQRERSNNEAVQRVAAENQVASLHEKIDNMRLIHDSELARFKADLVKVTKTKVSKDINLRQRYADEYALMLQQAKEHYANAAEAYRQQLKANFKLKFATVDDSNLGELSAVRSELQSWKTKFTAKEVEYASMSRRLEGAQARISDLEGELSSFRAKFDSVVMSKDMRIQKLEGLIQEREETFKDLTEERICLVAEITQYRRLLNSEYSRLGIEDSVLVPVHAVHHKQIDSANGDDDDELTVEIRHEKYSKLALEDIDVQGGFFVVVSSTDARDIQADGYTLTVSGGRMTEKLTFPKGTVIPALGRTRILSAKGHHMKMNDDVMWDNFVPHNFGSSITLTLADADGKKMVETKISMAEDQDASCLVM